MHRFSKWQHRLSIGLAACVLGAAGFGLFSLLRADPRPVVERVAAHGKLIVATRRSPTTYFQGAQGPDGFEHALVRRFAQDLGVEVAYVFPDTLDALLEMTARGKVHMAAAGLTVTPAREQTLLFSIPYKSVTEHLIYRRGSRRPRTLAEIGQDELHVIADSSHDETLRALRDKGSPDLSWQRHAGAGAGRLLAGVDQGKLRYTIADSNEVAMSRRVYKHVATAFELGEPRAIAWAFPKNADTSLRDAANDFIERQRQQGILKRLQARYFGHAGRLNFVDTREFWRHVRDRLPALRDHFEQAAELTGIDWRLLAAIGYQESHWRPDAVSPTGVRGVMMLTRATAKQMGIANRLDPAQSIIGGARYLRRIEQRIPARIKEPDRLWLTLAGYNVGFGHLEDARILTERDGANPDLWLEIKQRLPLLAKKKYHSTVRHGFARGQEPVDYVDNIRNYYDLLVWFTTTNDRETLDRLIAKDDAGDY